MLKHFLCVSVGNQEGNIIALRKLDSVPVAAREVAVSHTP